MSKRTAVIIRGQDHQIDEEVGQIEEQMRTSKDRMKFIEKQMKDFQDSVTAQSRVVWDRIELRLSELGIPYDKKSQALQWDNDVGALFRYEKNSDRESSGIPSFILDLLERLNK